VQGRDEKCIQNSERKDPVERHKHKWEDNIRMDLKEITYKVVDWIHLVLDSDQ
jgi:hypothetical protein